MYMKDRTEKLREYARLLIRMGLNVQKGQTLIIASPVDCAWFARMCAEEAYAAGCREVVMNWRDDQLERLRYLHADDAVFVEILEGILTDVRDIAGDLLGAELGVARVALVLFDVQGGEHVLHDKALVEQDSVLVVVALSRLEDWHTVCANPSAFWEAM